MLIDHAPVVAVPARNEAERLPYLLKALDLQISWSVEPGKLDVVVVLNNTTDASAEVVTAMKPLLNGLRLHVIETSFDAQWAHVGSARRLAMDTAAQLTGSAGTILTTDADAIPRRDWVLQNLRAIRSGADVVGGHIVGDPKEEAQHGPGFQRRAGKYARYAALCDELASLIDPVAHDPWPRHRDHTGGSLAVRADVYHAVGGMPALPFREDVAFVSRCIAAGYRLVHPNTVTVVVSARLDGRAPGGMADCVKSWLADEIAGRPVLVVPPETVEARLIIRHAIRHSNLAVTHHGGPAAAERSLQLPAGTIEPQLAIARRLEEHCAVDLDAPGTMPVDLATGQLEQRLQDLKAGRDAA